MFVDNLSLMSGFVSMKLQVKVEGRTQFLTAVCMACLEGAGGRAIRCRFCTQQWDGSSLVLGTMYSYDIFAAMPCCTERIKVWTLWNSGLNPIYTFWQEIINHCIFCVDVFNEPRHIPSSKQTLHAFLVLDGVIYQRSGNIFTLWTPAT